MKRRTFLSGIGAGAVASFAGCVEIGGDDDGAAPVTEDGDEILTVATYSSFLDAPSISPGEWIKEEFESEFDARLIWQSPPQEVNHYIQRQQEGVNIEADLYLGLNTEELVRVDEELDEPLFVDSLEIDGQEHIREGLDFDPQGRAIPYSTGYISLVYDSTETDAPETFDGLLEPEHEGELLAQNPGTSTTGRAFLLHTIHEYGEDGYLEFWSDLQENEAEITGSWDDAYDSYMQGEAPMVVSYSTDQVFSSGFEDRTLDQHQIRFLNDQAYANPEGMAIFQQAPNPDLAEEFAEFILRPNVQGEIAEQNVVFPATDNAELREDYQQYAHEPPEPVTFTYEELQGSVSEWIDDWERAIVQ